MRKITLIPNQPPVFEGQWTVGEILQMAQLLANYVNSLPVSMPVQPTGGEPDDTAVDTGD
jgi:hypothetical protein